MTPNEAAEVLSLMRGSWPNLAQDEVGDRLWLEDLMGCDAESALKTFRWLRDNSQFPPSWAEFLERYSVDARPSQSELIALEGPREPIRRGNGTYEETRKRQRESRPLNRINHRPPFPLPIQEHFEATTPMLTYDEAVEQGLIEPGLI